MSRGRPREFDKTEALESAMFLFWRNGYRGTSLDDLTEAMKITRPSLYAAFTDKETLFLQAVDHYLQTVIVPKFRTLIESPAEKSAAESLAVFFSDVLNTMTNVDAPGCLIACMLEQDTFESAVIKQKLAQTLAGADQGFARYFEQHAGELRAGISPQTAGKLMTTMLHGLATRARAGAGAAELHDVALSVVAVILK